MDSPGAFIVALEPIGVQDELEVRPVLFLPVLSHLFRLQPAVVSGSGDAGHFAQLGHGEDIALLGQRRPDDTEPKTGALHRYCPEPGSSDRRISFFKNAICCWRYTISFWRRCSLSRRDIFSSSAWLEFSLLIRIRDFALPLSPSGVRTAWRIRFVILWTRSSPKIPDRSPAFGRPRFRYSPPRSAARTPP